MGTKVCSKCKVDKPITEFHKSRFAKDGFNCLCKQCRSETRHIIQPTIICPICGTEFIAKCSASTCCSKKCSRRYYYEKEKLQDSYKDRTRSYQQTYRKKNRENLSIKKAVYQKANWDKCYGRMLKWINENKDHLKSYRIKNKDHINERDRIIKNRYAKQSRILLLDSYVKRSITQNTSLKASDIHQSLIEVYRIKIQIARLIKSIETT